MEAFSGFPGTACSVGPCVPGLEPSLATRRMLSLNFTCVTPQDGLCEPPATLRLILAAAPPPLTPIGCNRPELRANFLFSQKVSSLHS